eukprot:Protomagalhaensia_sp_Gyna_25__5792@NODE_84_length_5393_cov_96_575458_g65_i0_p4_GENE_NODE_84_length_5393_cov_96_575458_g65_i0NODE_84_length_5393_cov_96_575458_g65_i0_p4_ORF_typecomplete_len282_score51_62SRAP/PF02586_14/3e33_NODE_84_length_5393_cov_96_575458_g65_i029223767
MNTALWGLVPHHVDDPSTFKYSTFNARLEGLQTNRLYKPLIDAGRSLVFADGFYEWDKKTKTPYFFHLKPSNVKVIPKVKTKKQKGSTKQDEKLVDLHILKDVSALASEWKKAHKDTAEEYGQGMKDTIEGSVRPCILAGLYDLWMSKEKPLDHKVSATVITMPSKGTPMERIHDRMPCCISPAFAAKWSSNTIPFVDLVDELRRDSIKTMNELIEFHQVSKDVGNIRNNHSGLIEEVSSSSTSAPAEDQMTLKGFVTVKSEDSKKRKGNKAEEPPAKKRK